MKHFRNILPVLLIAAFVLGGCAQPTPETIIETVEVPVEVIKEVEVPAEPSLKPLWLRTRTLIFASSP